MRTKIKIPRIIKIEKITDFKIQCMFNNGESRILDFTKIFEKWQISDKSIEAPLLNLTEFQKVELRNFTLSWPNIVIEIPNEKGEVQKHPYEIGPDVLYRHSEGFKNLSRHRLGILIRNARLKAGLTQEQLAMRSGTTRFYISRLENDKTDVEMSTFRKIVEAGLGKNLKLLIE
jgi:DNA-binding XRE family transcriptional regulator